MTLSRKIDNLSQDFWGLSSKVEYTLGRGLYTTLIGRFIIEWENPYSNISLISALLMCFSSILGSTHGLQAGGTSKNTEIILDSEKLEKLQKFLQELQVWVDACMIQMEKFRT